MESVTATEETATIEARNIGGIDHAEVSFRPGVTLLSGRNATNRTSLLQAVTAAVGSEKATLKGDADSGSVSLSVGGSEYTRSLSRRDGAVRFDGDPYLDSPTAADLFAFLLGDNEARRSVLTQEDLRDVIMRPVDTEAIRRGITEAKAERRDVEEELERLEGRSDRLADLRDERERLESALSSKSEALESRRRRLEEADRDLEASRERDSELDEKMEELRDARASLERTRERLRTNESSLEALSEELAEHERRLDEVPETAAEDVAEIEARVDELRARKSSLDATVNRLREVVRFNEEMLEGNDRLLESLDEGSSGDSTAESLTRELVEGDARTCWTCGTEVDGSQIEGTLERLRSLVQERVDERREVEAKLSEHTDRKNALEERRRERETLERKLDRVRGEIDDREAKDADLRDERSALAEEIESIEATVEDLQGDEYAEVLEHHRQVNQLEFETESIRDDLSAVDEEIESVESELSNREELETKREELSARLRELRTRIDRLEEDAVGEFNEHMETVLNVLQYENIDRIWLERVEREVREGRRKVRRSFFELHVVRSSDSGASYEDTVAHLSESEQNVTGLLFALAGYLVHDVYESCPFMLLDSLESIDSRRIVDLVEYFADYSDYLVVALLPEDAAAFDDDVRRITSI